ncbi:hypothetical protein [Nocardia sp. NPDC049707]|uniref:hypothetical protein n=1 Tax=Nocardia sp. NPDC049707 TaxID=3154735 RepID=UPI00342B0518
MRTAVRGGRATAGVVGALAGAHALRCIGTRVLWPAHADEYRDENVDLLDADRSGAVFTEDGVCLATRECGPSDAPVTVIFVHIVDAALDRLFMRAGVIEDIPATAEVAGG